MMTFPKSSARRSTATAPIFPAGRLLLRAAEAESWSRKTAPRLAGSPRRSISMACSPRVMEPAPIDAALAGRIVAGVGERRRGNGVACSDRPGGSPRGAAAAIAALLVTGFTAGLAGSRRPERGRSSAALIFGGGPPIPQEGCYDHPRAVGDRPRRRRWRCRSPPTSSSPALPPRGCPASAPAARSNVSSPSASAAIRRKFGAPS